MKSRVGVFSIGAYIIVMHILAFIPLHFKGMKETILYLQGAWMSILIYGFFCFKVVEIGNDKLTIYSILNPMRFKRIIEFSKTKKIEARRMTTPSVIILYYEAKKEEVAITLMKFEFKNLVNYLKQAEVDVDVVTFGG